MNNIAFKKEKVIIETIKNYKIVKLQWVPKFRRKLRKEFKKFGTNTIFTLGRNLKNLICRNKSKLLPNSFPGVYQLDCTCHALCIGETKKRVITGTIEHQQDSFNGDCESSGPTEHYLKCHGQFNWINPKTVNRAAVSQTKNKRVIRNLKS